MSWTCISSGTRTARKQHRCYFCNEAIAIGMDYEFRAGVCEDGWDTMKMHPECAYATRNWQQDDYECFDLGSLKRGINEIK